MKKRIVIVGSSFAGYTAAVHLAKNLGGLHEIIVIDSNPEFVFTPSLVWQPFGQQELKKNSFDTRPLYNSLGITFMESHVYGFDLQDQYVYTPERNVEYDYLLIATGSTPRYSSIKGLDPESSTCSVCYDVRQTNRAREVWNNFVQNPGLMVIGFAQWAGYTFVAYEFLFNTLYNLHKVDLLDKVPIHFITPEPYLTHFGIGGLGQDPQKALDLFRRFNIKVHLNAEIHEVKSGEIILEDGSHLPSSYTMIIPPFYGTDAVKTTRKLADEWGRIAVTDELSHPSYPNVYAAGGTVSVLPRAEDTKAGLGVPCTHSLSETMGKTVAQNIAAELEGGSKSAIDDELKSKLIRKDLRRLGNLIFRDYANVTETLDYIAKGAQEKWAEHSVKRFRKLAVG